MDLKPREAVIVQDERPIGSEANKCSFGETKFNFL